MNRQLHPSYSVGWNNLPIPKLQLYRAFDYLPMLVKRVMWEHSVFNLVQFMIGDAPAKLLIQRIIPIFNIFIASKCGVFLNENGA